MNMMGSFGGGSGGGVRGMGSQQQVNRQVEDLIPSVIAYLDSTYGSAEEYIAGQRERMQGAQQGGMGGLNLTERITNDAQRVGYDANIAQTRGRSDGAHNVSSAINAPGLIEALLNAIMQSSPKETYGGKRRR